MLRASGSHTWEQVHAGKQNHKRNNRRRSKALHRRLLLEGLESRQMLDGEPTVAINQAAVQVDPTSSSPIRFSVVFDEAVTGFTSSDVSLSGTAAGSLTAAVTQTDVEG